MNPYCVRCEVIGDIVSKSEKKQGGILSPSRIGSRPDQKFGLRVIFVFVIIIVVSNLDQTRIHTMKIWCEFTLRSLFICKRQRSVTKS